MERELHEDGKCNDPRPWNWREACHRIAGHHGPHWSSHQGRHAFWDADHGHMDIGAVLQRLDDAEAKAETVAPA